MNPDFPKMIEEDYETAVEFMGAAYVVLHELSTNRDPSYLHRDDRSMIEGVLHIVTDHNGHQ